MRRKLGPVAAWTVTLALLVYIFSRVPFHEVLEALGRAAPWTVPVALALVLVIYAADSFAMQRTFSWFVTPLRYSEVLVVRGATYLLALVNYALGQGAIVYFVKRTRGVPVTRGAATVLLIMGVNVLVLLGLASLGLVVSGARNRTVEALVVAGYAGLAAYLVVIWARPAFLTKRPIFEVLFDAGIGGHLKAMVVRLPHVISLIAFQFAMLRAFGVRIPIGHAIMFLPVILLSAIVPSFLGLGPVQASMVALLSRYAPGTGVDQEATVLAAGLAGWTLPVLAQIAIALVCLRSHLGRGVTTQAQVPS
jgi:hypothetical protein